SLTTQFAIFVHDGLALDRFAADYAGESVFFVLARHRLLRLAYREGSAASFGDNIGRAEPDMHIFVVWSGLDVAHFPQTDRLLVREKPGRVLRPQPCHVSVLAENHLVAVCHCLENDTLRFRQLSHLHLLLWAGRGGASSVKVLRHVSATNRRLRSAGEWGTQIALHRRGSLFRLRARSLSVAIRSAPPAPVCLP